MWVWVFPNHKCQKILTNQESNFGMSDLENPILTFLISQYLCCWKLQIRKNLWNYNKMMVFLMFTLCKVARKTYVHTLKWCFFKICQIVMKWEHEFFSPLYKVWTWQIVLQFRYYSSFLQCSMSSHVQPYSNHKLLQSKVEKIVESRLYFQQFQPLLSRYFLDENIKNIIQF